MKQLSGDKMCQFEQSYTIRKCDLLRGFLYDASWRSITTHLLSLVIGWWTIELSRDASLGMIATCIWHVPTFHQVNERIMQYIRAVQADIWHGLTQSLDHSRTHAQTHAHVPRASRATNGIASNRSRTSRTTQKGGYFASIIPEVRYQDKWCNASTTAQQYLELPVSEKAICLRNGGLRWRRLAVDVARSCR